MPPLAGALPITSIVVPFALALVDDFYLFNKAIWTASIPSFSLKADAPSRSFSFIYAPC